MFYVSKQRNGTFSLECFGQHTNNLLSIDNIHQLREALLTNRILFSNYILNMI